MTREELKEHCKRQVQQFERVEKIMPVTLNDWKRYEEHKLILELLEQQPCEDYISRQAVEDAIYDATRSMDLNYGQIMDYIDKLPPVQPQPKMGYWITTRTFMHDGEFYCDRCKCDSPNNKKWDYCPNCGAKMVEPQESEG